ncbi:Protein of unknown function DUF2108, membrane [Methanocaldococcus fervens AG86]|uniref:Energy-converting hydrogenase A, subunit D n=1 Tax=Methanocaldococcus fervens (strain DSM 4213 / JCM 15782 / AG86) TaxID=573064 RepID=C7P6H6_METFA|nr:Protein of unknown function DUF2108, membrane [Methanocaldococcus fervens AG86]
MKKLEILPLIAGICCVLGGIGVIVHTNPINKIIMFALLEIGMIGLIISSYYLDIAIISSLCEPICTIILLLGYLKYITTVKKKKRYGRNLPVLSK